MIFAIATIILLLAVPMMAIVRLIFLFIRGRVLQTLVAPISEEKCDLGGVA